MASTTVCNLSHSPMHARSPCQTDRLHTVVEAIHGLFTGSYQGTTCFSKWVSNVSEKHVLISTSIQAKFPPVQCCTLVMAMAQKCCKLTGILLKKLGNC